MIFISVLEPLKSEHVVPVVETDESFPSRLPFTTHNSNNDVHDVGGEEDKDDATSLNRSIHLFLLYQWTLTITILLCNQVIFLSILIPTDSRKHCFDYFQNAVILFFLCFCFKFETKENEIQTSGLCIYFTHSFTHSV